MSVTAARPARSATSRGPACCPTGLGQPIDRQASEELAELLKAVADPARLRILAFLRSEPQCSACVADITEAVGLSQPTVSHHLRRLAQAGIVEGHKQGYWTWYSLKRTRLAELGSVLT
ncbi:MAG: winged helix-turn-helix transcriptional regulator [Actinobacteria bacterium]|nr:winged helix-turn-helix transcriptional regulator [Actinomycetota bacterium]